jgi:hypothetical protein
MAAIRIRFVAGSGFIGGSIRWVTNSLFQHVEFGTPEGTWIGAHASGGIEERPADYASYAREFVYDVPATDAQLSTLMIWARTQVGVKYNYRDIIGLLLRKRQWTTPNRAICSQFCVLGLLHVFGAARVLNVLPTHAYLITPETLHLSPLFVGRLTKKVDSKLRQQELRDHARWAES